MAVSFPSTVSANVVGTIEEHPRGYAIVRYYPMTVEIPPCKTYSCT